MRRIAIGLVGLLLPTVAAAGPDDYATPLANARVSLTADGAWLPSPAKAGADLQILEDDHGPRVQFIEHLSDAWVRLYVERAALTPTTLAIAEIYATPPASTATSATAVPARTPGAWVSGGTPIAEVTPARNGFVQVRLEWGWSGGSIAIRGYLDAALVGPVFHRSYRALPDDAFDVTLPTPFELLATPGGAAFATGHDQTRVEATTLAHHGAFTLVRLDQGVVGWIATRALKPIAKATDGEADGVEGGVIGGVMGGPADAASPHATLPEHTALYDRPHGQVIGAVERDFLRTPTQRTPGWLEFDASTPYGKLELWAHDPAAPAH